MLFNMLDKSILLNKQRKTIEFMKKKVKVDDENYLKYKISHFENDKDNDDNFPKVNLIIHPLVLTDELLKRYHQVVKAQPVDDDDIDFS